MTPVDAAASARAAKTAFERGLNVENLAKIAAVLEGKAMNGELPAVRMLLDYYGLPTARANDEDERRPTPGNVMQVNFEADRAPRLLATDDE